ncbi:hypothetical protein ACFL27_10575 [candidate division CSSED10-310 bacterium]|uniref:Outer membrane protein beta-barrel domain-containing protein n=1 Tax=candidate division CSSED10-310 bacterium TaxID=2855610 RepID=A0ABV6YWP1_UNCC1
MRFKSALFIIIILWCTPVFASEGQPSSDWTFSLGAKVWYAAWIQQGTDFGSAYVFGPTLSVRRKNISFGGSYLTSSVFSKRVESEFDSSNTRKVDSQRDDIDLYVSYSFNTYFSLALGFKKSMVDVDYEDTWNYDRISGEWILINNDRNHAETMDFSGLGLSVTGLLPIKDTQFFVHWALSFSYMSLKWEAQTDWLQYDFYTEQEYKGHSDFSETDQVWAYGLEINGGYSFSHFVVTIGYRFNEFSTFETEQSVQMSPTVIHDYSRSGEDRFHGPTVTIVFKL